MGFIEWHVFFSFGAGREGFGVGGKRLGSEHSHVLLLLCSSVTFFPHPYSLTKVNKAFDN
jgi:hypothetical protein